MALSRRSQGSTPGNDEIARALHELSLFQEMAGVEWRPRAYEKAAQAIAGLERSVAELYREGGIKGLDTIPRVGKSIATRIAELIDTGRCRELDDLREQTPVDILGLCAVEGVGPKHVKALYEALGIRTLAQLGKAASSGRIRHVPHFGERSEQKILSGVRFLRESKGRLPTAAARPEGRARQAGDRGGREARDQLRRAPRDRGSVVHRPQSCPDSKARAARWALRACLSR